MKLRNSDFDDATRVGGESVGAPVWMRETEPYADPGEKPVRIRLLFADPADSGGNPTEWWVWPTILAGFACCAVLTF